MIYLFPESVTLTHRLVMILANLLLLWKGLSMRTTQHDIQFISTIDTAMIAEKRLKARFFTAIST